MRKKVMAGLLAGLLAVQMMSVSAVELSAIENQTVQEDTENAAPSGMESEQSAIIEAETERFTETFAEDTEQVEIQQESELSEEAPEITDQGVMLPDTEAVVPEAVSGEDDAIEIEEVTVVEEGAIVAGAEMMAAAAEDVTIDALHFPDALFRNEIKAKYDTDKNDILSVREIMAVTEMEVRHTDAANNYMSENTIQDLSGIEYFTALKELDCSDNSITRLDLRRNTAIESLCCSNNWLESLDVSGLANLSYLDCSNNYNLKGLDIRSNLALEGLDCSGCSLISLDVSKNVNLYQLYCSNNYLASLDLSKNQYIDDPDWGDFSGYGQSREVALMQKGSNYWLDIRDLVGENVACVTVSEGTLSDGIWTFTQSNLPNNQLHYKYNTGSTEGQYLEVELNYYVVTETPISGITELTIYNGEEEYPVVEYIFTDNSGKTYARCTGVTLPKGISYNIDTNTLTLNDCNLEGIGYSEAIRYVGERELNIRVLGRNTYERQYGGSAYPFISVGGNANINGNGTIAMGKNAEIVFTCKDAYDASRFGKTSEGGKLTINGIAIESSGCQIADAKALTISNARISQSNANHYTRWQKEGGYHVEKDKSLYNMYALQAGKLTVTNSVIELKNTRAAISCGSYSLSGQNIYVGVGKAEKKFSQLNLLNVLVGIDDLMERRYAANDYGDYFLITTQNLDSGLQKDIKVQSLKITADSKNIAKGKKVKLNVSVTPADASNIAFQWSTSNKKFATVNSKGVVKTKAAGAGKTVKITAEAKDGSGKKAVFTIRIMKGVVKKVALKGSKAIKAGKKTKLKTTVKASKGAYKKLAFSSSNPKYATVNKKGVVKALKSGKGKTVTITAKALDGSGKKAKIKIKIK